MFFTLISFFKNQSIVPVINKRAIGKLIVRHCGNEGQQDDPTLTVNLRTILQTIITELDTQSEETWKNAEIVIYDKRGNDYCIRSGEAQNKFVVQLDEEDEIRITCTHREKGHMASLFTRMTSLFLTKIWKPAGLYTTLAIDH